MSESKSILLIGIGAIGTTLGNWLAPHHSKLYALDQGETLKTIREQGLTSYSQFDEQGAINHPIKTIEDLNEIPPPDYVIICVKNYSLEKISKLILDCYGSAPTIVALQNGIENQRILPKYFPKVIYGVVCYNAWLDSAGIAGYQKKGPFVIGTLKNQLKPELKALKQILRKAAPTVISNRIEDTAISKMIINLTNSFTTLIGFTFKPIACPALFQKILTGLTYEGVKIAKAAGFGESKMGGMPSWSLIKFSYFAPLWLTRRAFNKNIRKMVISSMAQDVIQNHSSDNELETINGKLLDMAASNGVEAPINQTITSICRKEFSKEDFKPLDIEVVWQQINHQI